MKNMILAPIKYDRSHGVTSHIISFKDTIFNEGNVTGIFILKFTTLEYIISIKNDRSHIISYYCLYIFTATDIDRNPTDIERNPTDIDRQRR